MTDEYETIADAPNGQRATMVTEIDEAELTCRILEGFVGMDRPNDLTAREVLALTDLNVQRRARRAATNVIEYFRACITNSSPIQ